MPNRPDGEYWSNSLDEVLKKLQTGADGISSEEAAARFVQFGPNELHRRPRRAFLLQLFTRFRNPLVVLLLAAGSVSAMTGDAASAVIIAIILSLSVLLDTTQEYRAAEATEKLSQSVAVKASVMRDGHSAEIPLRELVPGDVVLLSAGDVVPGDARIIEARDFFVDQSLLTGESYPVEKQTGDAPKAGGPGEAVNGIFMGSAVVSGTARAVLCCTGPRTALGDIAESLIARPPPTAFDRGTRQFGMLIMHLTLLLVLFVVLVNIVLHRPLLESFVFAVALAVGLTPELLPMVVTVTLARGALRMARKRVVTKHLQAIQNLGSMNVLCTDKTGTLTEAHIRLERHLDVFGHDSDEVLKLAFLNSYFETGLRSPLDTAILEHGEIDIEGWRKVDEVPFDFERRRVSVLLDDGRKRRLIVKGAPEEILRLCAEYESGEHATKPLDAEVRERIQSLFEALGADGFRVLGVAWRGEAADRSHVLVKDESGLVFSGFCAFFDPPKAEAAQVLSSMAGAGITVKIVTGDNERVTRYVCRKLGLEVQGLLTGADLQALDERALQARINNVNIFCRVTPAQKNRIILALKRRGHTVGYLGDGINDASCLHSADVGISVDSAADVAKQAADMILLEHDLGALYEGVREGRRTFGNVMKYIMMATSSNFGNMFSMAAASLILPYLPMLPIQVLLNNLLYDVSEIPIPMDFVDEPYLAKPRKWDMTFIRNFMWVMGPVSSLFDFITFFVLLYGFHAREALFHTGWFMESVATQVLVIFVIRTRFNPLVRKPSPWLAATSLAVVLVAMVLPYSPLASYLGFVPPAWPTLVILGALVAVYLGVAEAAKRWFYRRLAGREAA